MAMLELLQAKKGPVLEDYAEEAPKATEAEMENWVCPINLSPPPTAERTKHRDKLSGAR